MTIWHALNAGTRSFQGGVNWVGNTVDQVNRLRDTDEQNRENQITSAIRRDMTAPAPPTGQPPAPAPQVPQVPPTQQAQQAPPAEPAAPAPTTGVTSPASAPQEQTPDPDREAYATVERAARDLRTAYMSGQGAVAGQPALNREMLRDTVTGQGMLPPVVLERGMRQASGNANGTLSQRDLAAYMAEGERRLAQAGLGHRADAWRARVLQQVQSAATRTMAVAAAQAESGDLQAAARTAATAYGFVPDGVDVRVVQGANGQPMAQRINSQGEPLGAPIAVTPQSLREMAIQVADPGAMETLLVNRDRNAIAREELAERSRHNRAQEANARARGAGGGGAGREVSLTPEQMRVGYNEVDEGLEGYTAGRPARGPSMEEGQVRMVAQSLVRAGVPGREASRIATEIGLRRAQVGTSADGAPSVLYHGQPMPLPPATAALLQRFVGDGAPTGGVRAAPTHLGRNAVRPEAVQ